jgi:RNA polymerase sigma-70 factor, ECF subfamily
MSIPVEAAAGAERQQQPVHLQRRWAAEACEWLRCLRSPGPERAEAILYLRELLLQAARFEVERRRPSLPVLEDDKLEVIACESADAALIDVLARLDEVRLDRSFSTWVYKFAIVEAATRVRKIVWEAREAPHERNEHAALQHLGLPLKGDAEEQQLISFLKQAIDESLTPHERHVLAALAVNHVPIDVLAERLDSTRAGVYETLRQARVKLRGSIAAWCDLARGTQ